MHLAHADIKLSLVDIPETTTVRNEHLSPKGWSIAHLSFSESKQLGLHAHSGYRLCLGYRLDRF